MAQQEQCTLDFQLTTQKRSKLILARSTSPVAFTCATPSKRNCRKQTAKKTLPPGFASITMSSEATNSQEQGSRKVPLFLLASATETKKSCCGGTSKEPPPPAWRVLVGNLAAGATAGCAVEAALYPIDTIKTRLQAMIGGGGFQALMQQGGGKALYAGVWGNLAGVAPSSAIFMACYEPVKQYVQSQAGPDQQFLGPVLAGMAAGTASSLTRVPTEVIKSRLQTKEFKGAIDAIRAIVSREGLRGLYAGYGAFMMRDLPFDAIEFVTYEQIKKAYRGYVNRDLHPGETSIIGAFAGGFTGVITTPLDVLKTRLMTQGTQGRYKNLFDAASQIARTEGMSAFMSGWQPRLMWISLGGFVFFPVLEAAMKFYAPKPASKPELPVTPLVADGKH